MTLPAARLPALGDRVWQAEKEARENANSPAIGSADANFAAWFEKRDGKTAKDLADSQYLGLNPNMPGY